LHRGIAQLLYLATHIKPDVLFATILLTSRVQKLTQQDLSKFMDILSYLNYTTSMDIMLIGDSNNKLRIFVYADASFGVHGDSKSQGGNFISYGRGPILSKSNKLKKVSKSSSERILWWVYYSSSGVRSTYECGVSVCSAAGWIRIVAH
jgi:hypothetical protein